MGARGFKSKAELQQRGRVKLLQMREPPSELSPPQKKIWRSIMLDVPQERMNAENVAIITQLCRHLATANIIGDMINFLEQDGKPPIGPYQEALRMRERESKMISNLSARLRIGIEGYNRAADKVARRAAIEHTPWQDDES